MRLSTFLLAGLGLAAMALPAHARVSDWHQGMTFASWQRDAYLKSSAQTSLSQLAGLGADWVAVVPHWHMSDRRSSRIYADTSGTASDDSVRTIIRQAHARGLKVMLKPHVDPRDGTWRGSIKPSDPNAWFASYRDFIRHYARMASETGVEMLSVGCEYKSLSGSAYTRHWRSIVADVRAVYRGPLTYAANWGPRSWGEYYAIEWWDALNYIGVDAYFPLTRASRPSVEQGKAGWYSYTDRNGQTHRWVDDLKALSQKFGKKVIFTELGFNTVSNPGAEWEIQTGTDQTGAKNLTEATFQVFDQEPWMAGIFWWTWNVDPNRGGASDRGMDINNKPMASTIKSWFGHGGTAARLSPPARPQPRPGGSADTGGYDFESGTRGWEAAERVSKLWSAANVRSGGRRSLGVWADGVSKQKPGYARVRPPRTLRPGSVVSARVYVGAGSNVVARLYVQDGKWRWVAGSPMVSVPGRKWTRVAVQVPKGMSGSVLHLGVQLMAGGGSSYTGAVYIDDVRW